MAQSEKNARLARRLISGMGLALIAYGAAIVWVGHVTITSKHSGATRYEGAEALPWAILHACFGVALLGVLFRKPVAMGTWMGCWLAAGILQILLPLYF